MFGGSGRKLIAEQAGAALPGALVAASAAVAVTRSAVGHPVALVPAMTEAWIAVHA